MKKYVDGRAEALKQKKNKILGKQIKGKLKGAMYEVANVLKKKDFQHIDKAAQKSIKDVKKKLWKYEKQANDAIAFGADIDCTIEEVSGTAQEARSAARRVEKLIDAHAALASISKICTVKDEQLEAENPFRHLG